MNILGNIIDKIFHSHNAAAAASPQATPGMTAGVEAQASNTQMGSSHPVDVDAVLSQMATQHSEHLDWKTSIVGLKFKCTQRARKRTWLFRRHE